MPVQPLIPHTGKAEHHTQVLAERKDANQAAA